MNFVQLDITAIRQSNSQNNAYVLLLNETIGKRQLPIVIGWCEARSIAIALDGTEKPSRPLTHDLFKTLGDNFDIAVQKVIIHTLIEGVFHAAFHCKHKATGEVVEIDGSCQSNQGSAINTIPTWGGWCSNSAANFKGGR